MFNRPVTFVNNNANSKPAQIEVFNEPIPVKHNLPPPSIYPMVWNERQNPEMMIPPGLEFLRSIDTIIINEMPNFFQSMFTITIS